MSREDLTLPGRLALRPSKQPAFARSAHDASLLLDRSSGQQHHVSPPRLTPLRCCDCCRSAAAQLPCRRACSRRARLRAQSAQTSISPPSLCIGSPSHCGADERHRRPFDRPNRATYGDSRCARARSGHHAAEPYRQGQRRARHELPRTDPTIIFFEGASESEVSTRPIFSRRATGGRLGH